MGYDKTDPHKRDIAQVYGAFCAVFHDNKGLAAGLLTWIPAMVERAERRHATNAAYRFFPDIGDDGHIFFFAASGAGDSYPVVFNVTDL